MTSDSFELGESLQTINLEYQASFTERKKTEVHMLLSSFSGIGKTLKKCFCNSTYLFIKYDFTLLSVKNY